ncbi:MAG: hypothetical protein OXQ29_23500, partial [Rhodospirillaceae bacterium]|nr:hypothetical protein [Rhodospirillaceae bacterium]
AAHKIFPLPQGFLCTGATRHRVGRPQEQAIPRNARLDKARLAVLAGALALVLVAPWPNAAPPGPKNTNKTQSIHIY